MKQIDEYILLDKKSIPIYKTFDLLDLATKIINLNKEIIHINTHKKYEDKKIFNYKLVIEKYEIIDLEKSDK